MCQFVNSRNSDARKSTKNGPTQAKSNRRCIRFSAGDFPQSVISIGPEYEAERENLAVSREVLYVVGLRLGKTEIWL